MQPRLLLLLLPAHKKNLLPGCSDACMDHALSEEFIRQYIAGQEVEQVVFNWHGGEPALAGPEMGTSLISPDPH